MKKRIIIISQTESFLTKRGQRHPDLAKYLIQEGREILYVSSNFYHAEKRFFSKEEINSVEDFGGSISHQFIEVPPYFSNVGLSRVKSNLAFAIRANNLLRDDIQRSDAVIVASRPVETIYFLARLKKKHHFSLVMDVRDIWPDAFNIASATKRYLFRVYCNFFLKGSVKKYDKFLYTCPSFLSWIQRYSNKGDAYFSPLGYDKSRFKNQVLISPRSHNKDSIRLVVIGLMQRQLNIIPLIKALEDFPNLSLDIYGDDGSGELFQEVLKASRKAKHKNVNVHGQIPPNEVPEILGKFDIGVVPMDAEHAFPNKVFDYIALSLPILAMGNNDVSRFVISEKVGWHSSFDVLGIKETLELITKSSEVYNESAKNIFSIRSAYGRDIIFSKINHILTI